MYRVGVKQSMDVGHFLVGDFGDESIPHRHDYEVEWRFEILELDSNGFSVDIAWMRELLEGVAEELRGTMLNDHPFFESRQTSVEYFARFVFCRLTEIAESMYDESVEERRGEDNPFDSAVQSEVIVWETPEAWASYSMRSSDAS